MKKIEYILKHNIFMQKIYIIVFSYIFRFLSIFIKVDKKLILFQSLIGKNYGDSPRQIFEKLKEDEYFKDYKYVWAFANPDQFEVSGASKVKINSLKYFITSLKAGIWITNVNIERGLKYKQKDTLYLNTWHGVTLKFLGNAQKNRRDYNYSDVDIMISPCEYFDNILINDFKVKKDSIIRCGLPRNEELYNIEKNEIEALRKKYNIPKNKKVILYAPTWRDSNNYGNSYSISPPIDIKKKKKSLSSKYVLLFRMHHLTTNQIGLEFDDDVRDVSGKEFNINELMKLSDILISDYSGTIFDYSILEKPIVLFAYDYQEYKDSRGLYLDLDEFLPNCVVKNQQELLNYILNIDYEKECKKVKKIKKTYMNNNGDSTELCIKLLKK